jgi:uncharacterized circularly permuted ATP-grasp superfamily protein/uncharacterized alpha-E superfamily protein
MSTTERRPRTAAPSQPRHWFGRLAAAYTPLPGVWDEMMGPDGRLRPPWDRFAERLAGIGGEQLRDSFDGVDRHLRQSGVFFRAYDDPVGGERPWPLTPVPLLIDAEDWRVLSAGAIQRARLAEAITADIYGSGRLVSDGLLPAAVVAGSPNYLRPLAGVPPRGGRHLRFFAVDIGRDPSGRWWVLSDRAQAPSGAGYALENRLAVSRALPEVSRQLNVDRLAAFFMAFRDELTALNAGAEARVGLMTPGSHNETYFEHAYLARYLGFLLLEGGDLTVRDDAVYVRTVSGLKRIDVLWRRLDGDFADPLELRTSSRLGVPGLTQAIRAGSVAIVNALGSGVIEARALMGFMPALARHILGEDLILPNLATWWCGQEKERAYVLDRLDDLAVASAFTTWLPGLDQQSVVGRTLGKGQRAAIEAAIAGRGLDIVGQEDVRLSTMPVWDGRRLVPRPFVLRLFVAAVGADDWIVMPGGFCRISGDDDARFVSMQHGASTSDVWVLSETPVGSVTLLNRPETTTIRRSTGTLPSRSADNLFWLSRYLERAEDVLRTLRALIARSVEAGEGGAGPLAQRIVAYLTRIDAVARPVAGRGRAAPTPLAAVTAALSARGATSGLPFLTGAARNAGAVIRDRLSPDAFQAVTDIAALYAAPAGRRLTAASALDDINGGLRRIATFSGLSAENMNRSQGWRFLELGRRIERALSTARFLAAFAADPDASTEALDLALELGDSQITYRWRYVMRPERLPVLDLLALDGANPRSIAFELARIVEHLEALPAMSVDGRPGELLREARRLAADVANTPVEALAAADLDRVATSLMRLSGLITERFFAQRPAAALAQEELE